MAFQWDDIQNLASARSVREKINGLGAACSGISEQVSIYNNVLCSGENWTLESSVKYNAYVKAGYPYRNTIEISGVTGDMIPIVNFDVTQQVSGEFIGAETDNGKLMIWSKKSWIGDFIIPNIIMLKKGDING